MKRLLLIPLLSVFLSCGLFAQSGNPDGVYAVMDSLVLKYVGAIQTESVETKQGECVFLINSVKDSLLRQHLAVSLFKYYKDAPVMGDEAVAIWLYDNVFAPGKVHFRGEFEALDAEMFCNLNRNTLLGMDAPVVLLRKPCIGRKAIPEKGKTSLIWFYDTACSKCKAEAKLLPGLLGREVDFPLTVCAVYAGRDRKAWREFRRTFKVSNPKVKVEHYWDPEISSDYLRLYGVMSTPRMYVVAPEGSIIGRRLELDSLLQLLPTAAELEKLFTKNQ
ncbi:MAG: hypothetical protein K5652_04980 [Bacteroidales bacterium]|nr:hypothetical protein [Bacteroidales bacterium]